MVPTCPYPIQKVQTYVVMGDRQQKKTITRQDLGAFSYEIQPFGFLMNKHFLQMRNSTRYIQISHWGNVFFKDVLDMVNRGANFEGHYSNIDLREGRTDSGKNAFRVANIKRPYNVWGLDYRDELRNISTSAVRRDERNQVVNVSLKPRFILLGGWNHTW